MTVRLASLTALLLCSCSTPARAPPALATRAAIIAPVRDDPAPGSDVPITSAAPDLHARVEREAAAVFRAMHDDFLRCFARARPPDHAYLVLDVLVGPGGDVRDVETTGGARVGGATACIARRVARASFPTPHGGGTSRIRVALAFGFEP
jgi:hypothetical protein